MQGGVGVHKLADRRENGLLRLLVFGGGDGQLGEQVAALGDCVANRAGGPFVAAA